MLSFTMSWSSLAAHFKKRGNIQLGLTVSQIRAAAHFEWHILPQPCCSGTTYSPGFVTQSPQTSIGHCNVLLHFKACLLLPQKHFSHTYRFSPTPTDFHLHLSDCSLEVSSYFCSSQGKMLCLRHERKPVQRQAWEPSLYYNQSEFLLTCIHSRCLNTLETFRLQPLATEALESKSHHCMSERCTLCTYPYLVSLGVRHHLSWPWGSGKSHQCTPCKLLSCTWSQAVHSRCSKIHRRSWEMQNECWDTQKLTGNKQLTCSRGFSSWMGFPETCFGCKGGYSDTGCCSSQQQHHQQWHTHKVTRWPRYPTGFTNVYWKTLPKASPEEGLYLSAEWLCRSLSQLRSGM